tara:strand:+ start:612 stop:977 length:366 start_codon:yes stop_codon:yes gene_type:complete
MKKGDRRDGLVFHAGFPNAGEDQARATMSLDARVVRNRASTYFWELDDDIPELGWMRGSIVVVDKALVPKNNDLLVAVVQEEFSVRQLRDRLLWSLDGKKETTEQIAVWGVITHVLNEYRT